MKVVILGVTGMLGNGAARILSQQPGYEVYGVARPSSAAAARAFLPPDRILPLADIHDLDGVRAILTRTGADAVINAIGVVKQLASADDPLVALPINALLPHQLARLCGKLGVRFVHVSTDCVFDGARGNYREDDIPNATDLYGRSKLLGEVDYPNAVTLRTSIVGHELGSHHGLIDWFLRQQGTTFGFTRAIFSGLTTVELSRVIARHVLPNPQLRGLYQVSSEPISKFDLLGIVARVYGRPITLVPKDQPAIDRSLRSERFRAATGYVPPSWRTQIEDLRAAYESQALAVGARG